MSWSFTGNYRHGTARVLLHREPSPLELDLLPRALTEIQANPNLANGTTWVEYKAELLRSFLPNSLDRLCFIAS